MGRLREWMAAGLIGLLSMVIVSCLVAGGMSWPLAAVLVLVLVLAAMILGWL